MNEPFGREHHFSRTSKRTSAIGVSMSPSSEHNVTTTKDKKDEENDETQTTTAVHEAYTTSSITATTTATSSSSFSTSIVLPTTTVTRVWRQVGQTLLGDTVEKYHSFGLSVHMNFNGTVIAIGADPNHGNINNDTNATNQQSFAEVYQLLQGNSTSDSFVSWNLLGDPILPPEDDERSVAANSVFVSDSAQILAIYSSSVLGGLVQIFGWDDTSLTWRLHMAWEASNVTLEGEGTVSTIQSMGVSSDGTVIALGVTRNSSSTSSSWAIQAYNTNTGQRLGQTLEGYHPDRFALSEGGTTIVTGGNGAIRIIPFDTATQTWLLHSASLLSGDTTRFGYHVKISDDATTIAASDTDSIKVFGRESADSRNWEKLESIVKDLDATEASGIGGDFIMSRDGKTIATVGYIGWLNPKSRLQVFQYIGDKWIEQDSIFEEKTDEFLCALSYDGSRVCCGAPYNTWTGNDIGEVRVYELMPS